MKKELLHALRGQRVLLTGHTGFKGGWLALWLASLDAEVTGVAIAPDTSPSLFDDAGISEICRSTLGDIREFSVLRSLVRDVRPTLIFHLAAQPLVRLSYVEPLRTLETNIMGTANLLDAVRLERNPCAIVVVSSDKCYENREWVYGYRETDRVGGHDPYSASKGAVELVVESYRRSYFPPDRVLEHGVALATVRAGNVIGGGDWAPDRIMPDAIRALASGHPIRVRNPDAVRPWQHVLEPLSGYLVLASRLLRLGTESAPYCEAWNFGPPAQSTRTVGEVVQSVVSAWGSGGWARVDSATAPHEAGLLRLSAEKALARLGWEPRWSLHAAIDRTVAWYRLRAQGATREQLRAFSLAQIEDYTAAPHAAPYPPSVQDPEQA